MHRTTARQPSRRILGSRSFLVLFLLPMCATAPAQVPEWIWHDSHGTTPQAGEVRFFRKVFNVGPKTQRTELIASGDDEITVYLNGKEVARTTDWKKPVTVDVLDH